MRKDDQPQDAKPPVSAVDLLQAEVQCAIERACQESDLTYAEAIGVLAILQNDMLMALRQKRGKDR